MPTSESNRTSTPSQKLYPDISHAFNEVRREEQFKLPQPSVGMSYGWNPSLFGAQPTSAMNPCYGRSSFPSSNPHHTTQTSLGYGAQYTKNPAANPFLHAPQQSNFHMGATVGASNIMFPGGGANLTRPASSSDFENLRKVDEPVCDNVFSELETFDTGRTSDSEGRERRNSDLMHFSESDEKEYMSLDFFDPLYSRTRRESVSSKDNSLSYSFFEADNSKTTDSEGVPDRQTIDDQFEKLSSSADALEQFLRFSGEPLQEERSRSDTPDRPPPPRLSDQYESEGPYEKLHQRMFVDEESDAFCQMVTKIKTEYKSTDMAVNRGFVVSAVCDKQQPALSVKVIIHTDYAEEPIHFTCDIHSNVEHVISNVLYNHLIQGDMMSQLSTEDFILKVYDRTEYLLNHFPMSKYEYVHSCLKLDRDIQFQLFRSQDVPRPFLRTVDDDVQHLAFPKNHVKTDDRAVTKDQLETLMNTFYKEIESMRDHILKKETRQIHSVGVVQVVKAICMTLAKIETVEVSRKLKKVEDIVQMLTPYRSPWLIYDFVVTCCSVAIQISLVEELEEVLEKLLMSVNQLVKMYCRAFHTDFILGSPVRKDWSEKYVTSLDDDCIVQVSSAHRIPAEWSNKYDGYSVVCSLHFGKDKIGEDVITEITNQRGLCDSLTWDQWISFKDVALNSLPRETRLCMTLCGMKGVVPNNQTASPAQIVTPLGGVTLQLYSQKGHLLRGSHLVPLKMNSAADPFSPFCSILQPDTVLVQINFPDFGQEVIFPEVLTGSASVKKSFDQLLPDIQDIVHGVLEKDCISSCQADELGILWQYRYYLYEHSHLLPWILQGSNISWDYRSLSEIYALVRDWPILEPMQALELLLPQYQDSKVREFAVTCLKQITSDELADFLPQLVQALKYESYHASHLARLLLEQSCQSVRFAHQFFWLLKGAAAQDLTYKRRYELMFAALINVAGDPLYQEFRKQEEMVKILTTTAERVQAAKDKESVLKRELEHLGEFFDDRAYSSCLLPYSPGLTVTGIDAKSCSYFTSNAVPLKLVFRNPNIKAEPVYAMFKVGDDLRQDMLTMQMIRLMDRLWLKAGLDLKIITFACLATGPKKGIVEIITESDTLRKIQVQAGLTGSFKDRPIKEWLQGHNPTELEYQKAVENFTCSCAGYCVATYVLGVCDRHNDNIMLKQSGHMFHIDFNKFLGDSQMFGNIKRMIEDSLKSVFTQFNFFIHNLAQIKFSSHQEGALLSFVPKTYRTKGTDDFSQHLLPLLVHYSSITHQIYIFKIQRVNQNVCSYIFRHFSEFVEFSNKIREMFPLTSWPPPPSKYILGRSHIQTVAESRKVVIEKFLDELWQKSPEICESDIVYTFFHPLLRDEQEAQKEKLDLLKLKEQDSVVHIPIDYFCFQPGTLALPSPYVKTYLLPDPDKQTKRKTKIIKHSTHPTYNEIIEYKLSLDEIRTRTLQVSVWDHDMLKENNCLGAVYIKLRELDLSKEVTQWYKLEKIQITDSSMLA
ncbi:hypothetical protein FSP39_005228 [Pinctada imbricata]|uniref:Phosphatidylinositol-4-phosphate 3-kinase n=1 Tax=Pinctada imbricata TaxID=66713 RepID=A0AA88YBJ6_PINIB|nr:hypothetical protein FSP39_005228 [Pinctada imbricata]